MFISSTTLLLLFLLIVGCGRSSEERLPLSCRRVGRGRGGCRRRVVIVVVDIGVARFDERIEKHARRATTRSSSSARPCVRYSVTEIEASIVGERDAYRDALLNCVIRDEDRVALRLADGALRRKLDEPSALATNRFASLSQPWRSTSASVWFTPANCSS